MLALVAASVSEGTDEEVEEEASVAEAKAAFARD